jgi:hypothetical protein
MSTPAAASKQAAQQARGVLAEAGDDRIILEIPGTDYRIQLQVYQRPKSAVGKRIVGTIRAMAKRIDVVHSGGRYLEPLYGRPRRIQGEVLHIDAAENAVVVDAGVPVVCKVTDARQKAMDFKPGDFVSFDAMPGATFTPVAG